jgi:hypothetical protein
MAINSKSQTSNPEIINLKAQTFVAPSGVLNTGDSFGPSIFSGPRKESVSSSEDWLNKAVIADKSVAKDSIFDGFSKFVGKFLDKKDNKIDSKLSEQQQKENDLALIAKNKQILSSASIALKQADAVGLTAERMMQGGSSNNKNKNSNMFLNKQSFK